MAQLITLIFGILVLLLLSLLLFDFDILSPSIITCFLFFLSSFFVLLQYNNWLVSFSFKPVIIVLLGLSAMLLSEYIVKLICFHKPPKIKKKSFFLYPSNCIKRNTFFLILYLVDVLSCLIFVLEIYHLGKVLNINDFSFIGKVKESSEVSISRLGYTTYDISYYLGYFFSYLFAQEIFNPKKKFKNIILFLFPILLAMVCVVFRGGRGPIFSLLSGLFVFIIYFYRQHGGFSKKTRRGLLRKTFLVLILFVVFFYYIRSIVKGREYDSSFFDYISYYVGSPIYLFAKAIDENIKIYSSHSYFGITSFFNNYSFLNQLGLLDYPLVSSAGGMLNYVSAKTSTEIMTGNALTLLFNPYYDFGLGGMIIYIFVYYFLLSFVYYDKIKYCTNKKRKDYWTLAYSFFSFYITLSFYYCPPSNSLRPQFFVFLLGLIIVLHFWKKSISSKKKKYIITGISSDSFFLDVL